MRSSNIDLNGVPRKAKDLVVRYTKQGSIVVPGLSDAHGHILEHGKKLQLDLDGLNSPQGTSLSLVFSSTAHILWIFRSRQTN
jgi:predicted amidohydrolase